MVFDIVYLRGKEAKGKSLANFRLSDRKRFLEGGVDPKTGRVDVGIVTPIAQRIEFPYRMENASSPQDIRDELNAVMERKSGRRLPSLNRC